MVTFDFRGLHKCQVRPSDQRKVLSLSIIKNMIYRVYRDMSYIYQEFLNQYFSRRVDNRADNDINLHLLRLSPLHYYEITRISVGRTKVKHQVNKFPQVLLFHTCIDVWKQCMYFRLYDSIDNLILERSLKQIFQQIIACGSLCGQFIDEKNVENWKFTFDHWRTASGSGSAAYFQANLGRFSI